MIDLSIVIVNWNTEGLLRRCVDSVLAERVPFLQEVIVIDNASQDDSMAFLSGYPDQVRLVVNTENRGFAAGCNQGLRLSAGRYILLLGPDAEVLPGALQALLAFMDSHGSAGAAGPTLLNADGTLQPSGSHFPGLRRLLAVHPLIERFWPPPEDPLRRRDFRQIAEVDEVSGACLLIRRRAFEEVGFFDERFFMYFEEVDWCRRLTLRGWKVYYVPDAKVIHQWRSRSDPTPEVHGYFLRSRLYYARKHFGLGPFLLLRILSVGLYGVLTAKSLLQCCLQPSAAQQASATRYRHLLGVACGG